VWECVVEQWLGVHLMLSNKRLAMGCVEGYLLYSQVHRGVDATNLLLYDQYFVLVKYLHDMSFRFQAICLYISSKQPSV